MQACVRLHRRRATRWQYTGLWGCGVAAGAAGIVRTFSVSRIPCQHRQGCVPCLRQARQPCPCPAVRRWPPDSKARWHAWDWQSGKICKKHAFWQSLQQILLGCTPAGAAWARVQQRCCRTQHCSLGRADGQAHTCTRRVVGAEVPAPLFNARKNKQKSWHADC